MLKNLLLLLFFILLKNAAVFAQLTEPSGKSQLISSGISFPFGNFSKSHSLGAGLEYSRSKNRFGWLSKKQKNIVGFIYNGGADFYFGRNDKLSPSPGFKFKNLLYLHASAGAIYNPCNKGTISLTLGPAAEIYAGNTSPGFMVNLGGSYFVNKKIGITPAIRYMKQAEANALWIAAIKASIALK